MITDRQIMTDQAVHQLATNALSKKGASTAGLCSGVLHTYLREQGFDDERFYPDTVGRIIGEVNRMKEDYH